jgi:hypothetical protein
MDNGLMIDVEDLIVKVMAKYDCQMLYDILDNVCLYDGDKLVDININAIFEILDDDINKEINVYRYTSVRSTNLKQKGDVSNFSYGIKFDPEYEKLRQGLKYAVSLYKNQKKNIDEIKELCKTEYDYIQESLRTHRTD